MNNFNVPPANIGDLFLEAKRSRDDRTIQALQTAVQWEMKKREAKRQQELANLITKQLGESGIEIPKEYKPETPQEALTAVQIPMEKKKAEIEAENALKETIGSIGLAKALGLIDDKTMGSMLELTKNSKIPPKTLADVINNLMKQKMREETTKLMISYWSGRAAKDKIPLQLLTGKMVIPLNPQLETYKLGVMKPLSLSYADLIFTSPELLAKMYGGALGYDINNPQVLEQVTDMFRQTRQIAFNSLANSLRMTQPEQWQALSPFLGGLLEESNEQSESSEETGEDDVNMFVRFLEGSH